MRGALLGLLLALPVAAAPLLGPGNGEVPKLLREGRWKLAVSGVLCNACTMAVVAELERIPGVDEASFDYEEGSLYVTVGRGHHIRTPLVERALHIAGRRVDLGTRFSLVSAEFVGPVLEPSKPAPPPAAFKAPPPPRPALPPADFPPPSP